MHTDNLASGGPNAIKRLMVANRGEIAIRILRAASEMRIRTIAIYTYEDRYSLHRYKADEAYIIGNEEEPLKPYLDIEAIIKTAKDNRVDAIHPGYGFLSENVQFARRCREEGIIFIGPTPEVMEQLGDKIAAKKIARSVQVPVIEDGMIELAESDKVIAEAERIGFPVILKAAAGGGGRGMRVVRQKEDLLASFTEAHNEAQKAFGDGTIFIEKFIDQPKHIEVQLLADNHGHVVHLFERYCSVQRRFQKVVEIAPAPNLSQKVKQAVYDYALKIAKAVNYNNAGTVEFLVDDDLNFYFLEMNTRLQVEHCVTEMISGIDLVKEQIRVARGEKLSFSQEELQIHGHAIELRVCAEDPMDNFLPDTGTLNLYVRPQGAGVRVDDGYEQGMAIPIFYDPMIAKLVVWGRDRNEAIDRMCRAVDEYKIQGIQTTLAFGKWAVRQPAFVEGKFDTGFIGKYFKPEYLKQETEAEQEIAAALGSVLWDEGKKDRQQATSAEGKVSKWKLQRN